MQKSVTAIGCPLCNPRQLAIHSELPRRVGWDVQKRIGQWIGLAWFASTLCCILVGGLCFTTLG